MNRGKIIILTAVGLVLYGFSPSVPVVMAQELNSPNYSLPESYIGPGGSIESSSPNYQGRDTIGDVVGGNESDSTNYTAVAGAQTSDEPRLAVVIDAATINFGNFSTSTTATANTTFRVLNYTAHGYDVYTAGTPPSNGNHNLNGMTSTTTSQIGQEQYGINLVANTAPVTFGANPVQVPDGTFSFGAPAAGYSTSDNFRYNTGEKIAQSVRSSGETDFTISYVVNVAIDTPGGEYTGYQDLVVVGTY